MQQRRACASNTWHTSDAEATLSCTHAYTRMQAKGAFMTMVEPSPMVRVKIMVINLRRKHRARRELLRPFGGNR